LARNWSSDVCSSDLFDYLVEEAKGNNYKLKATFKEFSESSQGPDGVRLSYNTSSAKPDDKDVAQSWTIYKSITGQSFGMEIDNRSEERRAGNEWRTR